MKRKGFTIGRRLCVTWVPYWLLGDDYTFGCKLHTRWQDRVGVRFRFGPAGDVIVDWRKKARTT
jgi:hypothetical protein